MMDMEKVLNGLECCSKYTGDECNNCPYDSVCKPKKGGKNPLMLDAIALLKAQEPVEPVRRRRHGQIGYSCFCGMCGYGIGRNEKYCALCGRPVKWG